MLRIIRITIAVICFALITFFFLDFAGLLPNAMHALAHLQVVPAIVSISIGILAFLIIIALLFGRIYCSTLCPMGIYQDIVNRLARPFKTKKQKRFKYSKPKNILRYSVLAVCTLTFILGFPAVLGLLDPYSAYGRMVVSIFKPVYMAGNNLLESIFTRFNNYTFYKVDIFISSVFTFVIGLLTFFVIGYLAWRYGRTWCNTVCPVGTLLGFLSKYSLFKVRIDTTNCTSCGRCVRDCKSSCINIKEHTIDHSRCVTCFNCLQACKDKAISYTIPQKMPKAVVDTSKRQFLAIGAATAAMAPKAVQAKVETVLNDGKIFYKKEHPITPPGSVSREHFMHHCTSCHLCVSKCPANILKPAFMEYGIGGIMQPTVNFEKGFCNFDCTICGDICPNQAIKPLTVEEKHLTQMGYVVFLRDNCIVSTDETSCGACSEHCPTQAVSMKPYKDGLTLPEVNTDICVGCGGCEYVCPTYPKAIYIEGNPVHKEAQPFHDPDNNDFDIDGFGF
ncbi:4Fe-4S dicluster domain-containing protein [Bacteroides sp. OttesenSCG-928-D19]|nr:4Fe-4S dicluster domain-containing protein [Bacteroides sp. OttesenSCG-928-D19]